MQKKELSLASFKPTDFSFDGLSITCSTIKLLGSLGRPRRSWTPINYESLISDLISINPTWDDERDFRSLYSTSSLIRNVWSDSQEPELSTRTRKLELDMESAAIRYFIDPRSTAVHIFSNGRELILAWCEKIYNSEECRNNFHHHKLRVRYSDLFGRVTKPRVKKIIDQIEKCVYRNGGIMQLHDPYPNSNYLTIEHIQLYSIKFVDDQAENYRRAKMIVEHIIQSYRFGN